jgi:hypothetical protein
LSCGRGVDLVQSSIDDLRQRAGQIVKIPRRKSSRFRLEAGSAGVAGALAIVTLVWRDWIELVFGVDPDHGNGSVEWLFVAGLLAVAVALGGLAVVELRQAAV